MKPTSQHLTTADFIIRAQATHGDRYDYSQTVYRGSASKCVIACRVHGPFEQLASSHTRGQNCPACAKATISQKLALTTVQFIAQARAIHGGKYDYSLTEYVRSGQKVKIICPEHGLFEQTPNGHQAKGCYRCGKQQMGRGRTRTTVSWIAEAKAIHGEKYDYSQSEYRRRHAKIKIICPAHGVFEQVAKDHCAGDGCPACGRESQASALLRTTQQFIEKAQRAHGDRYDYSLVSYMAHNIAVKIICLQHGAFEQLPKLHLEGYNCQACGKERTAEAVHLDWITRVRGRACHLYLVRLFDGDEDFYKVGVTVDSVQERFRSRLPGYQYEVLALHTSTDAARIYSWEQSILETFAHLRYMPKNHFVGATECFSSCEDILAIFPVAG